MRNAVDPNYQRIGKYDQNGEYNFKISGGESNTLIIRHFGDIILPLLIEFKLLAIVNGKVFAVI